MAYLLLCFVLCAVAQDTDPTPSPVAFQPVKIASLQEPNAFSTEAIGNLKYYGGPVISAVKVFAVFWGSNVNYASNIAAFYNGVTKSAYFDWLAEYNTATQTIGRGSYSGNYTYTGSTSTTVTDATLRTTLKTLITNKNIPTPDANTFYAVHFAPGIKITDSSGAASCGVWCAYHDTISYTPNIYYSVIPDMSGGCASGCGTGTTFQNLCSVSSHELSEAVTDPAVGLATVYGVPLGWYDTTNGEISDICNAQQATVTGGDGVTYTVQKNWSNKYKQCQAVAPASTPPPATSGPTTGSCTHNRCTAGIKLVATCDTCVKKVCTIDSYCCSTKWDSVCVGEVGSVCGATCSATAAITTNTCVHSHCTVGVKLPSTCNACVTKICVKDPQCCSEKWDSFCVQEVKTYCNLTCPITGAASQSDVNSRRSNFGVFATFGSFPKGKLPQRTDTIPASGVPRNITVTCVGKGTTCLVQTHANLHIVPFKFAPPASTTPVPLYQAPANSTKVHILISPTPVTAVYLYAFKWPKGEYVFTKGKYEIKSDTVEHAETTDHSIEVTSSEAGEEFSGILEFPIGTGEIQWSASETLENTKIRFTLAYVVPN